MNDPMNEKKICPMCHKETDWGSMIWLNGQCTCPNCYAIKRADLDRMLHTEETQSWAYCYVYFVSFYA